MSTASRAGRPCHGGAGATLTEVLVSLLIMSIGIVSLATMFPLSVLRSAKATQLTLSTGLRYNAEALIDLYPQMVTDPDIDGDRLEHALLPPPAPPPNGPENYVVDPLGWVKIDSEVPAPDGPLLANYFGNQGTGVPWLTLRRYHLGRTTEPLADYMVTLPDSWELQFEGDLSTAGAALPITITDAEGATEAVVTDLTASGFTLGGPITYRVVFFDAEGITTHARQIISSPAADTIRWTEDDNGDDVLDPGEDRNGNNGLDHHRLPPDAIFRPSRVRIESQDRRYTWLLTVRKLAGFPELADVDVVIYFSRPFIKPLDDERLYDAVFNTGNPDVTVTYIVGGPVPTVKRGGYIFDAQNARWYRVVAFIDDGAGTINIRLEAPALDTSIDVDADGIADGQAMFPKAVVDVYPLGQKNIP